MKAAVAIRRASEREPYRPEGERDRLQRMEAEARPAIPFEKEATDSSQSDRHSKQAVRKEERKGGILPDRQGRRLPRSPRTESSDGGGGGREGNCGEEEAQIEAGSTRGGGGNSSSSNKREAAREAVKCENQPRYSLSPLSIPPVAGKKRPSDIISSQALYLSLTLSQDVAKGTQTKQGREEGRASFLQSGDG